MASTMRSPRALRAAAARAGRARAPDLAAATTRPRRPARMAAARRRSSSTCSRSRVTSTRSRRRPKSLVLLHGNRGIDDEDDERGALPSFRRQPRDFVHEGHRLPHRRRRCLDLRADVLAEVILARSGTGSGIRPDSNEGAPDPRRAVCARASSRSSRHQRAKRSMPSRCRYERHIAADLDIDLVLACAITPAVSEFTKDRHLGRAERMFPGQGSHSQMSKRPTHSCSALHRFHRCLAPCLELRGRRVGFTMNTPRASARRGPLSNHALGSFSCNEWGFHLDPFERPGGSQALSLTHRATST